jgi:hypothetical protein
MAEFLHQVQLRDIQRWLAIEVSEDQLTNYIYSKALYPATLPVTDEEMAIEQAITRQILAAAANRFFAEEAAYGALKDGSSQQFDAIVVAGSVFTRAPNLAQATLMLLDGLQPSGVTTLVLDLNQIMPALGAAAAINPLLVVQVLESSSFLHLGTVIAPSSRARTGSPVLRLKMTYESGHETHLEVKQGALEVLPLPIGQTARLHLHPLHRADVGMGAPGRGGGLKVVGGALGVIIDARGRPFVPPADRNRRQELFRKWQWTLGGQ